MNATASAPAAAKPRRRNLSVHELRKIDSPYVYVMNTSDLGGEQKGAVINLPIITERGPTVNVIVYNTFIPQDLSRQVMKKDLVENVHFMRMVEMGLITLVNEEWATTTLRTKDSRDESDRLRLEINKARRGMISAGVNDEDNDEAAPDTSEEAGVNAAVIDVVAREDLNETEKWSNIKRIENRLTDKDWKYIVKKTDADRLKALANNKLLESQGKDRTLGEDDGDE